MDENSERVEQFKEEIAGMHIRTPQSENERWLLILGVVLMVLGLLFIIVGYYGASRTEVIVESISYLISGGVLGLGLIVVGAVLFARYSMTRYLRYWLIRMVYEEQANTDRVVAALEAVQQEFTKLPPKSSS